MKPINLKFCAPCKIIYRNGRDSLNFEKTGFLSFSTISMKERFKKKIKSMSIGYSNYVIRIKDISVISTFNSLIKGTFNVISRDTLF